MDRIDDHLSRRAQEFWASALVICRGAGSGMERWILQRRDEPSLELGDSFETASATLQDIVELTA